MYVRASSAKMKANALTRNGYNSCIKYAEQYLFEGIEELLGKLRLEQQDSEKEESWKGELAFCN